MWCKAILRAVCNSCRSDLAVAFLVLAALTASDASARVELLRECNRLQSEPIIIAGQPVALEPTGQTGPRGLPVLMLKLTTTATVRGEVKSQWSVKVEMEAVSLDAFRATYGEEILIGIASVDPDGTGSTQQQPEDMSSGTDDSYCAGNSILGVKLADRPSQDVASALQQQSLLPPSFGKALAERLELRAWTEVEERAQQASKGCVFPPLKSARPVVVSSSGWQAVASHDFTGSTGVTSVVDMTIEEGSDPLYIMASSPHTIWRVSGARNRVLAFVVADDSGVSGLAAPIVHAIPKKCILDFEQSDETAAPLKGLLPEGQKSNVKVIEIARSVQSRVLKRRLGVEPLLIDEARPYPGSETSYQEGSVGSISIPSGQKGADQPLPGARPVTRDGDAGTLWARFMKSHSGGVIDVDPAGIISAKPLSKYEVLPEEGGFAQLIEQGAIEPIGWRNARRMADGSVAIGGRLNNAEGSFRIPFVFRVKTAIRLPVHPAVFSLGDPRLVLAPGVPEPLGNKGGVCIKHDPIDEEERARLEYGGKC
jgi:hypothetical protein